MTTTLTTEPIPKTNVIEAPTTFWGVVRHLGPGLILVGNIVGSGELIATPLLSAESGYIFLWLILFSCIIKVFFQIEIGRYAISTGRTTLESFNELPGPRFRVNWLLWYWLGMMIASLVQMGAMCGGVAQALRIAFPVFGPQSENIWAILTGLSVIILLWRGRYGFIEKASLVLVATFTAITIYTSFQIQFTPFAMSASDVIGGLKFQFPDNPGAIGTALMAFGITGVGASELIAYPYWCMEKGYGRFVGARTGDDAWAGRARGWIKVMQVDAWVSMLFFTVPTVAFFLLGAALLHPQYVQHGTLPEKTEMVERLSIMYSETFGSYADGIFLVGAFAVLYSTFLIATAANARMLSDWLAIAGFYDGQSLEKRRFTIALFCVVFPIFCTVAYLFLKEPVTMVMLSGVMQAMMLPLIGYGVMYFAYKRTDRRIQGGPIWFALLWISFALMAAASVYMAYQKLMG
ncbi:MAG: Nramp family divalent metal transporter [Planctomycetota bacterium]